MISDATRIIDISFPLDPKTYKNNLHQKMLDHFAGRPIGFEIDTLLERGGPFSSGQVARGVKMRLHVGTHVDAPEHWVAGGKHIEEIPLDTFIGEAVVADFLEKPDKPITERDLDERIGPLAEPGCRLLIKTGWNDRFFGTNTDTGDHDARSRLWKNNNAGGTMKNHWQDRQSEIRLGNSQCVVRAAAIEDDDAEVLNWLPQVRCKSGRS